VDKPAIGPDPDVRAGGRANRPRSDEMKRDETKEAR